MRPAVACPAASVKVSPGAPRTEDDRVTRPASDLTFTALRRSPSARRGPDPHIHTGAFVRLHFPCRAVRGPWAVRGWKVRIHVGDVRGRAAGIISPRERCGSSVADSALRPRLPPQRVHHSPAMAYSQSRHRYRRCKHRLQQRSHHVPPSPAAARRPAQNLTPQTAAAQTLESNSRAPHRLPFFDLACIRARLGRHRAPAGLA